MLHYGKNCQSELELHLTGSDIAVLYRAILSAQPNDRQILCGVMKTIEQDFHKEICTYVKTNL